jgi:hypothetical protein
MSLAAAALVLGSRIEGGGNRPAFVVLSFRYLCQRFAPELRQNGH